MLVKISDFGTSKINVGRTSKAKSSKFLYGMPRYVAPEILNNEDESTKICPFEADVFHL